MKQYLSEVKFSTWFAIAGTIVALLALFSTSSGAGVFSVPFGADVIAKLSSLPAMVFAVLAIWLGSKALYDYISLEALIKKASETSQGAGLVFIGVNIGRIALALLAMGMLSVFSN